MPKEVKQMKFRGWEVLWADTNAQARQVFLLHVRRRADQFGADLVSEEPRQILENDELVLVWDIRER